MLTETPANHSKEAGKWILSTIIGALSGFLLLKTSLSLTPDQIPLWLTFPFISLLLAIAITPLVRPDWWHHNYPNVSLFLGGFVLSIYGLGYELGPGKIAHAGYEYLSFLALIGGLFFVASCIMLDVKGKGSPLLNTALLGFGAVISNLLGTTGASMLLIRPFIKLNRQRIQPVHIVFFIIIVSNCGGALTPVGDPPLYLGYLKGVPFNWTLNNLFHSWAFMVGSLLFAYFIFDRFIARQIERTEAEENISFRVYGKPGLICLFLMIAAVFIDPILSRQFGYSGFPISAPVQILIAASCFFITKKEIKRFNEFTFEPFKEIALIFAGIFATMIPALDYLAAHGASLGLNNAKTFYYGSGLLSAFLDNAPTYLNFLQIAIGPTEINHQSIATQLSTEFGNHLLVAISTGAVFFGALTYIGNGPNFMVRSISESIGVKTPSFFGYFLKAACILGPLLVIHSFLFL